MTNRLGIFRASAGASTPLGACAPAGENAERGEGRVLEQLPADEQFAAAATAVELDRTKGNVSHRLEREGAEPLVRFEAEGRPAVAAEPLG